MIVTIEVLPDRIEVVAPDHVTPGQIRRAVEALRFPVIYQSYDYDGDEQYRHTLIRVTDQEV